MNRLESEKSRQRSRIEFCIEAFVEETANVAAAAQVTRSAGELSPLERLVASTVHWIFRDQDALPVSAGVWCRGSPARWDLLQFCAGHTDDVERTPPK